MDPDCLFCKIVAGEIPATLVYESEQVIGFHDISPQAPIHVLFIPREHISTINDANTAHAAVLGEMMLAASKVAADLGVADAGFRLVLNCNRDGGQTVYHIHLHLLAGRAMAWPPG